MMCLTSSIPWWGCGYYHYTLLALPPSWCVGELCKKDESNCKKEEKCSVYKPM
jgi:hypothetical protein